MDISDIKSAELALEIVHPGSKEPLGIKVTLVSLDDERVKKARRKITDRRLYLEARGKSFKAEELDENMHHVVFSCMTGWVWEGEATFHGKKPEFNFNNVDAVFTELPWFLDQIRERLNEDADFYKASN